MASAAEMRAGMNERLFVGLGFRFGKSRADDDSGEEGQGNPQSGHGLKFSAIFSAMNNWNNR